MTLPTDPVELALRIAETKGADVELHHVSFDVFYNVPPVLAAEVRALREELSQTLEAHERQAGSIRGYQATIARAQSLAERWQVEARQNLPVGLEDDAAGWRDGTDWADQQCAKELLAALRGES